MTVPGDNSAAQLNDIIKRINTIMDARDDLKTDMDEIYAEAKSLGHNVPGLRAHIKDTREDEEKKRKKAEAIAEIRASLAGLADTELGRAAIEDALRA